MKAASIIILVLTWIGALVIYFQAPDTILLHFDARGEVDRIGPKSSIFLLPLLSTGIFALFAAVIRLQGHPGSAFTELQLKQERDKKLSVLFLGYLRLLIMVIVLVLVILMALIIWKKVNSLSGWFFPLLLALILIPTAYYVYKVS